MYEGRKNEKMKTNVGTEYVIVALEGQRMGKMM